MTAPLTGPDSVGQIAVFVAPAGGVGVLREAFRSLQGDFPGAIVILLHAGDGREREVAINLNTSPSVMVLPAKAGERLRNGYGYVVPAGSRLAIGADGAFVQALPSAECEPLLASLAARNGPGAIAVALTGLGDDDIEGFNRVRQAGGHTFALDETDRLWADSSGPRVVPQAFDEVLPVAALGPRILELAPPVAA